MSMDSQSNVGMFTLSEQTEMSVRLRAGSGPVSQPEGLGLVRLGHQIRDESVSGSRRSRDVRAVYDGVCDGAAGETEGP